jgi:hypothetical protein
LHSNLTIASIDGIGPDDWFEPASDDCTATFNCVAHTVQLATMKDVFDVDDGSNNDDDDCASIKQIVSRVRKLCTVFNTSPQKAALLKSAQAATNRPLLAVVRDVPTRWLSLHAMLDRFVSIYPDVLYLTLQGKLNPSGNAADDRDIDDFIAPLELEKIRRWVDVLRPIADFVNDVEGEHYFTLAAVPVLLLRCLRTLEPAVADDVDTASLKRRLREALKTRVGYVIDEPGLPLAAAACDPRFGHLRFISDDLRNRLYDTMVEWAMEFPEPAGTVAIELDDATRRRLLKATFNAMRTQLTKVAPPQCINDPLFVPAVNDAKRYDALTVWRNSMSGLEGVKHIARLVLSVPATSAASERVFSSAGFIVNKNRTRLDDENVVMLATIRDHLKKLVSDDERTIFLETCEEKLKTI